MKKVGGILVLLIGVFLLIGTGGGYVGISEMQASVERMSAEELSVMYEMVKNMPEFANVNSPEEYKQVVMTSGSYVSLIIMAVFGLLLGYIGIQLFRNKPILNFNKNS